MTPFQHYIHSRWITEFPERSHLREELDDAGEPCVPGTGQPVHVRYQLPSPANPDNVLCVVFTPDDIMIKFVVPGSHEHYDPDLYGGVDFDGDRMDLWSDAYDDALREYIRPVIEDRMFVVYYGKRSALVVDVEKFLSLNQIESCHYESWSHHAKAFSLTLKG